MIFDLDGTLADTFPMIVSAWNAAVSPHTGKTYSDAEVISRFGIPDPQMIRRELPGAAGDEADKVYHAYYEAHHGIVELFPGIREVLTELKRRRVPMGVMTGKGHRTAKITLAALGIADLFGAVVTGEDVAHQKPDPEGPLLAAKRLSVAPNDCAFVGDSPADIPAGKSAGMLTIAAGWHSVYLDEIRALQPDVWARTPGDLLKFVASL
jgi:HAD superfamily hydrolase (TIGR01509 family)